MNTASLLSIFILKGTGLPLSEQVSREQNNQGPVSFPTPISPPPRESSCSPHYLIISI